MSNEDRTKIPPILVLRIAMCASLGGSRCNDSGKCATRECFKTMITSQRTIQIWPIVNSHRPLNKDVYTRWWRNYDNQCSLNTLGLWRGPLLNYQIIRLYRQYVSEMLARSIRRSSSVNVLSLINVASPIDSYFRVIPLSNWPLWRLGADSRTD